MYIYTYIDVFMNSGITSLLDSSVEGYRVCAFAFGQTGAGKTYTVIGKKKDMLAHTYIHTFIHTYICSYIYIYIYIYINVHILMRIH